MARGAKANGMRNCTYEHDTWIGVDGRLYLKLTAIEFERATEKTFGLTARRRLREALASYGLAPTWANGQGKVEVWDIARDWASDLPEAYTYRTAQPLPDEVFGEAVS